jgi:hypothetical protein
MSHKNYYITGLTALVVSAAIAFAPSSNAALTAYSQDFEAMTPLQGWPPNDLSADGWVIFGFAWDADPYTDPTYPNPSSANIVFSYGPHDAANGAPGSIQGVDNTGQGGPDQGNVVLSKFSDYNNPTQDTLYIQADTFQTQTITAGDVGSLWRFTYDAKIGNLEADSSAFAYIQTIAPITFFQTALVLNDSTNLPDTWGTYTLDLFITPFLEGDILSFGFSATSTNYNGSAVFYDNLSFIKVILVTIDIKPDSQTNNINPRSKGVIAVSVLTSEDFDALQVDPDTVLFGPADAEKAHTQAHVEDVDNDGDMDLQLHFKTQETGIQCGGTEATLTGYTWGGTPISGTDSVNTVGCK